MNILYIGPYRQLDYIGQVSYLHIESIKRYLKSSDKLLTKPLYLDTTLAIDKPTHDTELGVLDHIDIVIQYLPINFIAINKHIKNIAIPIIDPKLSNISNDYSYKILNLCDKILIDDEKYKNILKGCNIQTPIEYYEEQLKDVLQKKFDLDPIGGAYKFGFLGQYQHNKQILNKIIHSFLLAQKHNSNIKLYLFLRGSNEDKEELDKMINKFKKQLQIPEYIQKIYTFFGIWDQKESITALNSIDCFLSLNDDYKYFLYEKFFTSLQSEKTKTLINRQNTQLVEVPLLSIMNIYEHKNTLYSVNTYDLFSKMILAPSATQKHKKTNHPALGSIVCNKVL